LEKERRNAFTAVPIILSSFISVALQSSLNYSSSHIG
jgi:hypothetical protein